MTRSHHRTGDARPRGGCFLAAAVFSGAMLGSPTAAVAQADIQQVRLLHQAALNTADGARLAYEALDRGEGLHRRCPGP